MATATNAVGTLPVERPLQRMTGGTRDVAVVIPVDGRSAYLARSLSTLLRQLQGGLRFRTEVIIIDNARTGEARRATLGVCRDACRRYAQPRLRFRYAATRHADPRHRNSSYPINVGIRLATAPVVLICAADILHVTETLRQHAERHTHIDRLLLFSFCRDCPAAVPLDDESLRHCVADGNLRLRMASWTDWYGGMCCSAKRADLVAVRGFEECFCRWGYEDYDLARRLRLSGVQVIRDDTIQVLHQMHAPAAGRGWWMKGYAGLRQLLRVRDANRGRDWGVMQGQLLELLD